MAIQSFSQLFPNETLAHNYYLWNKVEIGYASGKSSSASLTKLYDMEIRSAIAMNTLGETYAGDITKVTKIKDVFDLLIDVSNDNNYPYIKMPDGSFYIFSKVLYETAYSGSIPYPRYKSNGSIFANLYYTSNGARTLYTANMQQIYIWSGYASSEKQDIYSDVNNYYFGLFPSFVNSSYGYTINSAGVCLIKNQYVYRCDSGSNCYFDSSITQIPANAVAGGIIGVPNYLYFQNFIFNSGGLYGVNDSPPSSNHTISITPPAHGTVTTSPASEAEENDTVIVTHTPDTGYVTNLANTTVKDANSNNVTYTLLTPTTFQFAMPASDVTITVDFKSNNPYSPGGDSSPTTPGGDGEFNNNSDSIPVPPTPSINYSDNGMVRLFSPSMQQIIDFGDFLWGGLFDPDTIVKAFTSPMENIISFHMVPIPVNTGASVIVKFAGVSTGKSMYPVTQQIYDVSMGTLHFPKYYGSSLDYSPYTQASIYLPYIGEIPLDVDECIGKTIGVSYKIDVFSGNLVAFVTIDGNVFYQKSGNCLQSIPYSQSGFAQIIGTATGLLASALSGAGIVGGGIAALGAGTALSSVGQFMSQASSVASQAAKPASDLLSTIAGKNQMGHSSIGSGISGYLGIQYPYINIKRVKQSMASSFASQYGYPLNVTGYLQDYKGYVKVSDIVFNGLTATDDEIAELYSLLRSGIVIYGNTLPTYSNPQSGMKVIAEYYSGVPNSPDKNITTKAELTGTFRQSSNISKPTLYLEGYLNTLLNETNMICIPEFKRRYYIKNVKMVTANSYELELVTDVLTSFWSEFKGSLAIIERAQNSYNLLLRDNLFTAEQDRLIQQLKFSSSFSTQSYIFALTGNNGTGNS